MINEQRMVTIIPEVILEKMDEEALIATQFWVLLTTFQRSLVRTFDRNATSQTVIDVRGAQRAVACVIPL